MDQMLKVLIIDADSSFASLLGRTLVKAGHETRIVGDAKYGIVRAKAYEADLVLVSDQVPGVATPQLIEDLKPFVPGRIVICGDSEKPEDIEAAKATGASDYILKKLTIAEIIAQAIPSADGESGGSATAEATAESDDENEEPSTESAADDSNPKTQMAALRAPLRDGVRPFVVVIAHSDPKKRTFQKEIVERVNTSLHVIEAATSEQAIAACAGNRTVMLMIDWAIPNIPTKQAMKAIREGKNGASIAIFVTYKSHSPEKQRLAEFGGAMAFAGEPWDNGSLEGSVVHVLDVIRKRRRKARMQAVQAQEAKAQAIEARKLAIAEAKAAKPQARAAKPQKRAAKAS
jgi:DNA-binding NtrC family response regulator